MRTKEATRAGQPPDQAPQPRRRAPIERATPDNPDLYVRASKTVYGRTLSVAEQLQNLENAHAQGAITGKEYEDEKKAIPRRGPIRLKDSIKGQWYDDLDQHVRCG